MSVIYFGQSYQFYSQRKTSVKLKLIKAVFFKVIEI